MYTDEYVYQCSTTTAATNVATSAPTEAQILHEFHHVRVRRERAGPPVRATAPLT